MQRKFNNHRVIFIRKLTFKTASKTNVQLMSLILKKNNNFYKLILILYKDKFGGLLHIENSDRLN